MNKATGICEMCGHHVLLRQKAHIVAEINKTEANQLMLCPTCHLMFDTHMKPKLFEALSSAGATELPASWKTSIYEQAAANSKKSIKSKKT